MLRLFARLFTAAALAVTPLAAAAPPPAAALTPLAAGAFAKPASFPISPPWVEGVTHTVTQAYNSGLHLGTDRDCCNNDFYAIDFNLALGETVRPVAPGKVVYAGPAQGPWASYGNIVFLDHGNGIQSLYAHLSSVEVGAGAFVATTTRLGGAGGTGGHPVHLHLSLYRNAQFYNTSLGSGPYAGQSVLPEPFDDCTLGERGTCDSLTTGVRLTHTTTAVSAGDPGTQASTIAGPSGEDVPVTDEPRLTWQAPVGTAAVHLQVAPLWQDGAGLNLVLTDPGVIAAGVYTLPLPSANGNYLLLMGATYQWRVRFSSRATASDSSATDWGAWLPLRSFALPRPSGATVRMVAPTRNAGVRRNDLLVVWEDSNPADYYYEVQMSRDPEFGAAGPWAPVFWNLVHGGMTNPPRSWRPPADLYLASAVYYARVRPRLQATRLGANDPGVDWTPLVPFAIVTR